MTGWRVALGVGNVEGEPTDWRALTVNMRVADASDAQLTLDGHSVAALTTVELATDLWVWRDDVLVFRGRIVGVDDSLDADRHDVTARAVDYRGMLDRRVLLDSDTLKFTQIAQAEIAWSLVAATQARPGGNLGITRGAIPAGQLRDRQFEAGAAIGDTIDSLAEVVNGFDWQVDEQRRLNIYSPRRGVVAGVTLEYGAALLDVDRTSASPDFANVVRVIGAEKTVARTVASAGIASDVRGRWETSVADTDLQLQTTVNDRASRLLADSSDLRETYSATLAPGFFNRASMGPGDIVTLVVRSGRLNIVEQARITELAFDADESGNDTVKVALVCEPGG